MAARTFEEYVQAYPQQFGRPPSQAQLAETSQPAAEQPTMAQQVLVVDEVALRLAIRAAHDLDAGLWYLSNDNYPGNGRALALITLFAHLATWALLLALFGSPL